MEVIIGIIFFRSDYIGEKWSNNLNWRIKERTNKETWITWRKNSRMMAEIDQNWNSEEK